MWIKILRFISYYFIFFRKNIRLKLFFQSSCSMPLAFSKIALSFSYIFCLFKLVENYGRRILGHDIDIVIIWYSYDRQCFY